LKSAADAFEKNIRPVVIFECCASHGGRVYHNAAKKVLGRLTGQGIIKQKRGENG
jgi:hypothetical protein